MIYFLDPKKVCCGFMESDYFSLIEFLVTRFIMNNAISDTTFNLILVDIRRGLTNGGYSDNDTNGGSTIYNGCCHTR